MTPAAPFVGAVTTRPPPAFSSLTASAYTVSQSIAYRGSSGSSVSASKRARRLTRSFPGSVPVAASPINTLLEGHPDPQQAGPQVGLTAQGDLVARHQLGDAALVLGCQTH